MINDEFLRDSPLNFHHFFSGIKFPAAGVAFQSQDVQPDFVGFVRCQMVRFDDQIHFWRGKILGAVKSGGFKIYKSHFNFFSKKWANLDSKLTKTTVKFKF